MTDEQLTAAFEGIRKDSEALRKDMLAAIQQAKEETIEASRKMRDEVQRRLQRMTETYDVRLLHVEANAGNLETAERRRMAIMEERVLAIEIKLGMITGEAGSGKRH